MPRTDFASIDAYIASFPPETGKVLQEVRMLIKKLVPEALETISYAIAAFKLYGRPLIYLAGFKNHISLYPAPRSIEAFKKELAAYKGGKGTVQFPLNEPLPLDLIRRIVLYRVSETKIKSTH
jgi:uncharacterized protein YdhG (YjbR/CyaY superfamily)